MSSQAHALVASLRGRDVSGAWRLERASVADRLDELIDNPGLVRQGRLNLCGPAAVIAVWFARDPEAAARYAVTLYETGRSQLGEFPVRASTGLLGSAYGHTERSRTCPGADWMMMASLRDSANRLVPYRAGRLTEPAGAITMPSEMRRWLGAINCYSTVDNDTNLLLRKGIDHATGATPSGERDVFLLVAQEMFRTRTSVRDRVVSLVPNHWVVLRSPVRVEDGEVRFIFWSWGSSYQAAVAPATFARCYFGTLTAIRKVLAAPGLPT